MKTAMDKKRVLFDSDYGCGKTLLMKHFASVLAKLESKKTVEHEETKKVFFVSLAAATSTFAENYLSSQAVIDVANELDFEDTDVQVHKCFYLVFALSTKNRNIVILLLMFQL